MRLVRLSAVELNQTPLDWAGNDQRIRSALIAARADGAAVVCLPEMCLTGYGCEDMFHAPDVHERAWRMLESLLPETRRLVVSFGLPVMHRNGVYNCAALAVDGKLVGLVAKRYLAGDGLHYEPRWFKPWPSGEVSTFEAQGHALPMGDLVFEVGGIRIGFEICEDAWVASRPGAALALKGTDVILNPSASHFAFGKIDIRRRFVIEGSRAFGAAYVYSNLLGNESGRAIYDGGGLIAAGGTLVAQGSRFSYGDFRVTSATVDIDLQRTGQARTHSFRPDVRDAGDLVRVAFDWPEASLPITVSNALEAWETGPNRKEEEFTRAVSLSLFDYMRKSRSTGFVVSLSGGADSAACAVLAATMYEGGLKELGPDEFRRKSRLTGDVGDRAATMRRLLLTAYQSTRNSGETTKNAARTVARGVGSEHLELDVDAQVQGYIRIAEGGLGRPMSWAEDDFALQNIQARARGPGIWMFANIRGALLLATSNRSEAAVGYATMDGDTCGGLSPIAGIDKNFLRAWLRWMETSGPEGLSRVPELSVVNVQAPTAELRPAERHQTDEDDLMPYDVLDAVERAAVRDKRSPVEIFALMRVRFPAHRAGDLAVWIERFFRLWCRNQWKRERFAPSFHLDDESLDPKSWCRFPILSGGFELELDELRAVAARG